MSAESKYLGALIREQRRARQMTQAELAEAVGVGQPSVSNWENGTDFPQMETLMRIGKILAIDWAAVVNPSVMPIAKLMTAAASKLTAQQIERLNDLPAAELDRIAAVISALLTAED